MKRAYRTTWRGIVSIVAAESVAQARYRTSVSIASAGWPVKWVAIRVRRAPEFDGWAAVDESGHCWAENQSIKSRYGGPALFVMDFLCCGCSMAYQFCVKHMPKDGWKEYPPPVGVVVLGCEDLGDKPTKMKLDANGTLYVKHGRKFEQVHPSYKARWWKAI